MAGGSYGGGIQLVTAGDRLPRRRDRPDRSRGTRCAPASTRPTRSRPAGRRSSSRPRRARARPAHHQSAYRAGQADRHVSRPTDARWFVARGPGDLVEQDHGPDAADPGHGRHAVHARRGVDQLRILRRHACRCRCSGSAAATARASPTRATRTRRRRDARLARALPQGRHGGRHRRRASTVDQNGGRFDGAPTTRSRPARRSRRPGTGTLPLSAAAAPGPPRPGPRRPSAPSSRRSPPARATNAVNVRVARRAAARSSSARRADASPTRGKPRGRRRRGSSPSSSTTSTGWCSATRSRRSP